MTYLSHSYFCISVSFGLHVRGHVFPIKSKQVFLYIWTGYFLENVATIDPKGWWKTKHSAEHAEEQYQSLKMLSDVTALEELAS